MLEGSIIMLTGGTGSFGKTFIRKLFTDYSPKKLIIFSRDELKQFALMEKLPKDKYPIQYILGDVRDAERVKRAMQGVDYVIHAAAYKHVPAAEYNPFEFVKTNIVGAQNIIEAALDTQVKKVVALSTDKACNPINLYGATKLAADKLFVAANLASNSQTKFSVVRYGNVVGSRGSVIPFFMNQARTGTLSITDPEMTRFWITLDDAVDMVTHAIAYSDGGELYIPKIPTMAILDLADAIAPHAEKRLIGIRPGEKLHEVMISEDDSRYTYDMGKYYAILPAIHAPDQSLSIPKTAEPVEKNFRYSSDINPDKLSRDQLKDLLGQYKLRGHELAHVDDLAFYGEG